MPGAAHFPENLTRHAGCLCAAMPLILPAAWFAREQHGFATVFAWLPILALYAVLPLLDELIGRDLRDPDAQRGLIYPRTVIPTAASAVYFVVLAWSLSVVGRFPAQFSGLALLGWTLSIGSIGGVVGINVAHELIHRRSRALRRIGGVMLASVWYPGFKIEHPRWHHVHVATPKDPSSAPVGSNIYRQVPRAMLLNSIKGWQLVIESARLRGRTRPGWQHEICGWYGLSSLMTLTAGLAWGWFVAVLFVCQGLAAALLEIINFIEHYGLERRKTDDGK